ncbi:MAG: PD-(D/E)XK nuclease family protein [Clostridia bacterium]|nr:PD-(D/E)XK nuclease family protein [Clostridia bacterium]
MITILKAYTLSECMEITSEYAAAFEKRGEENLIFCEDRLTLVAERALTRRTGGTFQSSVSTFSRYLSTQEQTLSKQGSVMAVGEAMTKLQRKNALQCFTSVVGVGNNARSIYETLAQLAASEITPEVLSENLALLEDGALKRKLSDLALIYAEYARFLRENGYMDESRYLSLLPSRIREDTTLQDKNVFFLCYHSFTAQAAQTIRAAIETAKNVVGVFCAGEEDIYSNQALRTFTRVCDGYGKVRTLDLGTPIGGEAEVLRRALFNPESFGNERVRTDKIKIFEAEDKIGEAEYVAVRIRKAMAQNADLHYRDFAVLVPDIGAYSLSLKRALSEYGIPYFIDEKRSLKNHPLSRFLLDCFRVVRDKFSPVAVQSLTQNVFFGDSDEYRNYLLKFANYRGGAKREIKTGEAVEALFDREKLLSGRERLLLATQNIRAKARGREYCLAVRRLLEDFDVRKQLSDFEEGIEDVSQKGYLSQIYAALERVLAEAELLTAEAEMTVAEFASVLKDGLDATEISLIPLKADAVFLGDMTDSRIEKVHTLFAVGMTEEVPRTAGDTAIVSDKEIEKLVEIKTLLEPTVAEVNLRSRESACLNLCTFMNELHLSYALGADGSEPAVSEIFRYVDASFCNADGKNLPRAKKLAVDEFAYRCSAPAPAIRQLLIEKSEYELCREDTRKEYSSLYTALDKLSVREKDDYLSESKGQVCVERGEELFFHDGKISPTALEGYFSCPFQNFVERGLRLKNREETAVLAVDSGNFVHELLERTARKAAELDTEEEMRAFALAEGERIMQSPVYASQSDTASGEFFAKRLLEEGAEVALAAFRQIKNSEFIVEETEMSVSTNDFHGKIDRVDTTDKFVRVIDYKTGSIDDSALSYYTGRKLQMQLYMSAIKGERVPAGVFYFPASVDYSDDAVGKFRMRGFVNGDEAALRCGDKNLIEGKQSEYFPAALGNNRSKRVMEERDFRNFLDYAIFVARQGCKELKEGYIAPTPYGESCGYCKYGGMCGFNRERCTSRVEESIDPTTIAEIARRERDGKEDGNE